MAKTFSGSVSLDVRGTLVNTGNLNNASADVTYNKRIAIANGTAVDQANMAWSDQRTLAASASENLDLSGILTDAFGAVISFTTIKGIVICAAEGNANDVQIGGAATNAFVNWVTGATATINVRPGGMFALYDRTAGGYAVTAGTGDILKITNSGAGTSVTYDIVIIGEI